MKIYRGYKYRAYPNSKQREILSKIFGCSRFVYNHFLSERKKTYAETGKNLSYADCCAELTELKKELPWLGGKGYRGTIDSMALQESIRDLDTAYVNFFEKRAGYPCFHRKNEKQSYRTKNQKDCIRFRGNHIRLPIVGEIRIKGKLRPAGQIKKATVKRMPSGKYFISLCVMEEREPLFCGGGKIGIDVGIKSFLTDSSGRKTENPRTLAKHERKLRKLQQSLSRKRKGSENRKKARIRLAREHEKIRNIRNDFLHKATTALSDENQVICAEDLNVRGMMKNHHLAKAVSDVSWHEFFRMLSYKLEEREGILVRVPAFYPSSQLCSCCGYKNTAVKDLSLRDWICPRCSTHHDRDENAAVNILKKGLGLLSEGN